MPIVVAHDLGPGTELVHRGPDGNLCLFEQAVYSTKMSILDIRNHACAWCWAYEIYLKTGDWPAAEH